MASSTSHNLRGPDGCRYDDSLEVLKITLVIQGIKKKLFHSTNADVQIHSDQKSMSCTVEIFKLDKKTRTVIDSRFYQVPQFPGEISSVDFKLETDRCILFVKKRVPQKWENSLSQLGL
ncbi:unnamed protein product [Auanema sp. JU1783]|nr:unnamed protein product [Auanema sp. JU1783]